MNKISLFLSLALGTLLIFSACKNEKTNANSEGNGEETTQTSNVTGAGDTYVIAPGTAKLNWEGSKLTGKHHGTIDISEGSVTVQDGQVTGGKFTIDMNTITNLDLEGEWKDNLEAHLKGFAEGKEDHFFNVKEHPVATFSITKVSGLEGNENANIMVYGDLTMKGVTKQVGFTANFRQMDNTVSFKTGEIVLNRTDWGVNYNSKSVFPNLQDNIIDDEIKINLAFSATKQ